MRLFESRRAIEGGMFPIQGPPGAGKTHTGARMICALVQAGKTVGVTANSHKVIRNLLDMVVKAAAEMDVDVRCIQKPSETEADQPRLRFAESNADLLRRIGNSVECGRRHGLALGVARCGATLSMCCSSTRRLKWRWRTFLRYHRPQPVSCCSAIRSSSISLCKAATLKAPTFRRLHHILGEEQTIAADRGLFLAETWRLHPDICAYTSEMFYEGRLHPRPGSGASRDPLTGPREWHWPSLRSGSDRRQSELLARRSRSRPRSRATKFSRRQRPGSTSTVSSGRSRFRIF